MGRLFPSAPACKNVFALVAETYEGDLMEIVRTSNFSADALAVGNLIANGIDYKKGQWVLLEKNPHNNDIIVGKIEVLICEEVACKAVVSKYCAELWQEYGIYKIDQSAYVRAVVCLDSKLKSPCPHPVYTFKKELTFSLKNVLLKML